MSTMEGAPSEPEQTGGSCVTVNLVNGDLVAKVLGAVSATWRVFILCAICTVVGVLISNYVFPPTGGLDNSRLFLLGVVIAAVMMLIAYGAKYSNALTRDV